MKRACLYGTATLIGFVFAYPFWWMVVSSFRSQAAVLSSPLRLLPEQLDISAWRAIGRLGGLPLGTYVLNSIVLTVAATALAVSVTALGAYALSRGARLPGFGLVRYGFLVSAMYPQMLLVMPLYFVTFRLGLLGSQFGIVLVLGLVPLVFFLFLQFFRSIPRELLEAARVDGASELQILVSIVAPISRPVVLTATLIGFLLNWKQWFPVIVLSTDPESYNLPVALLSLNGEYGVSFQATMALATLTTLPVVFIFLLTQRRILDGFLAGAVKG